MNNFCLASSVCMFILLSSCYMHTDVRSLSEASKNESSTESTGISGITAIDIFNDEATLVAPDLSSVPLVISINGTVLNFNPGDTLKIGSLHADTAYTAIVCLALSPKTCGTVTFSTLKKVTLSDVYIGNGNWNSYVRNNGTTKYNATNVACNGSETGNFFNKLCLHGGELKEAVLTGLTSCAGLTVLDSLGAFDWVCDASSGTAKIYSTGLKVNKGLADLVTSSGFTRNRINVYISGNKAYSSSLESWWTNLVEPLPTGSATLSTPGAIYVLESSRTDGAHDITADGISVVIKSGAVLTGGSTGALRVDTSALKFLWIEGAFENSAGDALTLPKMTFSRLENISCSSVTTGYCMSKVAAGGIYPVYNHVNRLTSQAVSGAVYSKTMFISAYDYFSNISASNCNEGMNFEGAAYSQVTHYSGFKVNYNLTSGFVVVQNFRLLNSTMDFGISGISMNLQFGVVSNVRISNMSRAIEGNGYAMLDVVWSNLLIINNNNSLYFNNEEQGMTVVNATIASSTTGYRIWKDDYGTFVNGALVNVTDSFYLSGGSSGFNAVFHQFFNIFFSGNYNLVTTSVNNISFKDYLLREASSTCTVIGGSGPNTGLVNTTCANDGTSTATQRTGLSVATTWSGLVTQDSENNFENSLGQASFASLNSNQAVSMTSFWRAWGRIGSSTMDSGARGRCDTSLTCQIWDWRLKNSDTVLRNTTGDGQAQNTAFAAGVNCPSAVHGNRAVTDYQGAPNTFLINATEIFDDSLGDNDGLCESNEACIYSPNYGAYQGEGDYVAGGTCTFQNGTVTGVIMYAYPTNGI